MKPRILFTTLFVAVACCHSRAALQTYTGLDNGVATSEIVSGGTLQLSGTVGSSISFTFTRGGVDSSTMNNYLVLFLDSRPGGYASTASFTDRGAGVRSAISGLHPTTPSLRATATFASGFTADYALVINPYSGVQLYELGLGQFTQIGGLLMNPVGQRARTYTWSVGRDALGLSASDALRFQSAYVTQYGSRASLESFEVLSGQLYFAQTTFGNFNIFEVQPVPESTNLALAIFGGVLVGAGCVSRLRRHWLARKC